MVVIDGRRWPDILREAADVVLPEFVAGGLLLQRHMACRLVAGRVDRVRLTLMASVTTSGTFLADVAPWPTWLRPGTR